MKIQEIKEALNALLSDIPKYDDQYCEEELRSWFMAAALRIWAGNRLFSEDYVKVLPVFKEQTYTVAQVITALDCAVEESRELKVPDFFQNIVINDKENNTSESRTFADSIGRFLVLIALINGDFTMEEASALKGISDLLIGYCDRQGVAAGKNRAYHPEMVTPLNRTSYYQPSPVEKKEPIQDTVKASAKEEKKTEVINPLSSYTPPMQRTERVTSSAVQNVNLMPEQPDEGKYSVSTNNSTIKKPANNNASEEETLDSVLAELNSLVGLESVKKDV